MDSGMIVMDRVDSDKLKPYLRGGSEDGSTNAPSLLHDSNGSADQAGQPSYLPLAGEATQLMGKSVVRGPQSDLLGALEELEREAEAEAAAGKELGRAPLWPAHESQFKVLDDLEDGYVDTNGIRPGHSGSQQTPENAAKPSAGSTLMQSLSAELPMPPPRLPGITQMATPMTGSSGRAREQSGQKAVLAGQKVQGDSTTMPFKPNEPFDLAAVAHQHLLDLALDDLSPPASDQEPANKPTARVQGHRPGAHHSAGPGPKTIRGGLLKDRVRDRETPSPAIQGNNRSITIPAASSNGGSTPGISPSIPSPPLSGPKAQSASPANGHNNTPPVRQRSGIPTALSIPRAELSRDAFNKTLDSTMSPTASAMLATAHPPDANNLLSPKLNHNHSPRPGRSPALNVSESTSLLPSPPGRASHADVNFRSQSSVRAWGSDMGSSVSRIPRSPVDASPSMDMTSMSLQLVACKLPALKKSGGSRPLSHRGSKIPLSPAGSAPGGSSWRAASLTPTPRTQRKKDAAPDKQGQAMEAATAELDRLAVMLKQMQEDIKAIPTDASPEGVQPVPTSPAPPAFCKATHPRMRSYLEDAEQSVGLAQHHSSPPQAVDTPDNEPLDKVEKMQETSTTVTVAGARGVRRPLHDAVAEEAVQGLPQSLPQASDTLSEVSSQPFSKASAKRSAEEGVSRMTSNAAVSRDLSTGGASLGASTAGMGKAPSGGASKGLSGVVPKIAAPPSQGAEGVAAAVSKEQNDRDCSSNSSAVVKARKQAEAPNPAKHEKSDSTSRRPRPAAKPEGFASEQARKAAPVPRGQGSSSGNALAEEAPAQEIGDNQLESQATVQNRAACVLEEEVSSAVLQPTEDDLVRVAVGTGGRVEGVVVHASRRPHNDLEALDAAKHQVEQALQAEKQARQQPVEHSVVHVKAVDPQSLEVKSTEKSKDKPKDKARDEPQDKQAENFKVAEADSTDAVFAANPKCACCFM